MKTKRTKRAAKAKTEPLKGVIEQMYADPVGTLRDRGLIWAKGLLEVGERMPQSLDRTIVLETQANFADMCRLLPKPTPKAGDKHGTGDVVHVLIGFSAPYVEACETRYPIEEEARRVHRASANYLSGVLGGKKPNPAAFQKLQEKKERTQAKMKAWREKHGCPFSMGSDKRGFFTREKTALDLLKPGKVGQCRVQTDCGYFSIFALETVPVGQECLPIKCQWFRVKGQTCRRIAAPVWTKGLIGFCS
jgi:hypothetical protein